MPNKPPIILHSMHGLGDNIFIRPFIRAATSRYEVWLATPWPEIFEDLPVHFMPLTSRLRTQSKNVARQLQGRWEEPPRGAPQRKLSYGHQLISIHKSITRALHAQIPLFNQPYIFDLPVKPVTRRERIAIIRPVTVRSEWTNTARNPNPEYVNRVAAALMKTHHVVLIADLAEGQEWLEGELPPHHEAHIHGEATISELMGLMVRADIVVGGVGWIVPMAIAARTKAFIILGGQGAHNSPSVITDPWMDLSRIAFAKPDNYCNCSNMRHTCNKTISNLNLYWQTFLSQVTKDCSMILPANV